MTAKRAALVDTCFVSCLNRLGPNGCSLLGITLECHGAEAVGDSRQLGMIDYCTPHLEDAGIVDTGISDQAVAEWLASLDKGDAGVVGRLLDDPVDLKLLKRGIDLADQCILLTCDRGLLLAAAHFRLEHACFKAAMETVDHSVGGILNDDYYGTSKMTDGAGHPFFHYGHDTHCDRCHPGGDCRTQQVKPPSR